MQINWFTVIAQVINFLILVWLLKRFLYKPILNAIDEREDRIKSQLKDADAKKAEAKKEQDEFIQKNEVFDKQKEQHTNDMLAEAKEAKGKLLEEARNEADALRTKLEAASKEMMENMKSEIVRNTQKEVFDISRKTLIDLASVSLEKQATSVFINRLKELNEEEKKKFKEAFTAGKRLILIQSTFSLSEKEQTDISTSVNELLGSVAQFQFNTTPKLISGIELIANGYKLAWSISEYLNSLERNVFNIIKDKPKVETE
jgi:F-type H+-transporting ATPase subunit b